MRLPRIRRLRDPSHALPLKYSAYMTDPRATTKMAPVQFLLCGFRVIRSSFQLILLLIVDACEFPCLISAPRSLLDDWELVVGYLLITVNWVA